MALTASAIVLVMLVSVLAVNALYWTNKMGVFAEVPAPADMPPIALAPLPPGDAASGESLFSGEAACAACHKLEPDETDVGPSPANPAGAQPTRAPA